MNAAQRAMRAVIEEMLHDGDEDGLAALFGADLARELDGARARVEDERGQLSRAQVSGPAASPGYDEAVEDLALLLDALARHAAESPCATSALTAIPAQRVGAAA